MSVYKRGNTWWYKFYFGNRLIRESAKTKSKTLAREAEKQRHTDLEERFNGVSSNDRNRRVITLKEAAEHYLASYELRYPSSVKFCRGCVSHLIEHLGAKVLIEIDEGEVMRYQERRLREGASGKSINEEIGELFRIIGKPGRLVRLALKEEKKLRLPQREDCGKALERDEEIRLLIAARSGKSPSVYPMIVLGLNTGMRHLTWGQVQFEKRMLTVGKSKTPAGEGRRIPLNSVLYGVLIDHKRWFEANVAKVESAHYVFPGGKSRQYDPSKPMATFKTAWRNALRRAGVSIRLHDLRHTAVTKLAESGAGDETIMAIAGHVSRRMLDRYAHIRTEAKRHALEAIVTKASADIEPLPRSTEKPAESPTVH